MLTLTEAVIIEKHNRVVASYERDLDHMRTLLRNEQASRRREREACDLTLMAANRRIQLLEEMVLEG